MVVVSAFLALLLLLLFVLVSLLFFSNIAVVSLVALLIAVVVPLLALGRRRLSSTKNRANDGRRQLPPSPPGLPILGHVHLLLLGSLPHRSLRLLATSHGPVMLLQLGRVPTVVASSAAAAEEAMKTRDLAFSGRPRSLMAQRLLYDCDVAFAPYGEYWRQARRVGTVHLLSPRRTASFRHVREQEVAALVASVRASAGTTGAINLSDAVTFYSKAIITRVAFGDGHYGLHGDDGGDELRRVLADFQELLLVTPMREVAPWLGWVDTLTGLEAKTRRTFEALDALLERVIADHRRRHRVSGGGGGGGGLPVVDDHRDFVDVLLEVNEIDKDAGLRLDTNNIKAIILDMFAAGTDPSSTVLEWAMAELMNHPDKMRKLQAEIRGAAGGSVTEDHLDGDRMPYLKAVISETMRLHAPAPLLIPRETTEDTELLGYRVPARTRVVINAWAIGRDPAAWERAEEFVPERFVSDGGGGGGGAPYYRQVGVGVGVGQQDFRFVPFGAGRRGCPGAGFAAPMIELALANLLYHFEWAASTEHGSGRGGTGTVVNMSEVFGLFARLKAPLILVAKPWMG